MMLVDASCLSDPAVKSESLELLAKTTAQYPGMLFHFHRRVDGTYCVPFASAGIERVFKLKPGDVAEDAGPLLARMHPEDVARVLEYTEGSAKSLTPWRNEYRLLDPAGGVRWVGGSSAPERMPDGSTLWRGYMEDITERKAAEQVLRRHADLPGLLSETAAGFINLPLPEVEGAIQASLARIAAFLDVDRAYIFAYDFERGITTNTFEWCGPGIRPCIDDLQATPLEMTLEWVECHTEGKAMYLPDVPGLPPSTLRDVLVPQGIKSLIAVPMMKGASCVGFVGFDAVRHHRDYTSEEQHLLDVFARMLVSVQLRRADQAALQRSERRFADVIEAAGEFVWEVDAAWRISYLSSRAEELFGRGLDVLKGERLVDLIAGRDDANTREVLAGATVEARPFTSLATRCLGPKGKMRFFLSNSRPVFTADGGLAGHIGISTDVTLEKEISQELRQAREQVEIFFEATHDLLGVFTPEGRFIRASRSWKMLIGDALPEIEGSLFMDYVHPDDREHTEATFAALLGGKVVSGFVNRYRCDDGHFLHLEWWAQQINGLVYASARDVTRNKEAEQARERALEQERAAAEIKGRLISMASHEFRTPLTLIRLRAEILGMKLPQLDEAGIRSGLSSIINSCEHLTEIVTDVLDYSTLGRAESAEPSVKVDMCDVLRDMAAGMERGEFAGGRIKLCLPNEPIYLTTYVSLLRRAVGNVLENSLKYSQAPRPVYMSCRLGEERVEVEVMDEGIGIPVETAEELFKPFYRASNVGGVQGTGLGLAICKEAVDRLGGSIEHQPNPVGGTIFKLNFPSLSSATRQDFT